jgi:hypothetical protein
MGTAALLMFALAESRKEISAKETQNVQVKLAQSIPPCFKKMVFLKTYLIMIKQSKC